MKPMLPLLCLCLALAGTSPAPAAQSPLELVRETSDQVLARLKADKEHLQKNPDAIYGLIEKLVLPHFDFERMSRLVLGKYWRRASPDQRRRFVDQFRTLLVRTYGTALLQYTGQKIEYEPLRASPNATDVTVDSKIIQPSGPPISVQYSLDLTAGEWKVYDVAIDGVSLVINYRQSFGDQIRREGIDALIQKLARKNKQGG